LVSRLSLLFALQPFESKSGLPRVLPLLFSFYNQVKLTLPFSSLPLLFPAGLLDATSNQVYSALAHHVTSQTANTQRMKAVGVWSLQMTAEMVVSAVRTAVLQGRDFGLTPPQGPEMMMTL
jgi:hypothetical protein